MKDLVNTHIPANLRKGVQIYVGSLWFYEDGFEYKAKSVNSNIRLGKILYSQISEVVLANTFGFVPNAILVKCNNGQSLNFIVIGRRTVVKFLRNKMKKTGG